MHPLFCPENSYSRGYIMLEETQYIIDQFQKNIISNYKRIAIYGIGKNTKLLIETFPEAPIVGLMDAACKESSLFGKKLLSDDEVVGKVDVILVVARKAVQGIIYPRIKKYKESGIQILNIQGERIGETERYIESDIPEYQIDLEDIKKEIDKYECISFDLFDTLIMRRFLLPSDVFEAVVNKMDFSENQRKELIKYRFSVETEGKALNNFDELYCKLANRCKLTGKQKNLLKQAEFDMEKRICLLRKECVSLLEYARELGKKIYILSDMYYNKTDLKTLCDQVGLKIDEQQIISSCDIQGSKENGKAFLYLINLMDGNKDSILHIGDNPANDYQKAREAGIASIRILSSYEMLLHSSLAGMLSDVSSYEKRCFVGLLISYIFNSPFALNQSKGKVAVTDLKEIGYVLGVIFYCFSRWMINEAEKQCIEQLILPGRDGYLIKKILDILKPGFDYVYIKASRRAYELSIISNKKDILCTLEKEDDFKGTQKQFFMTRFHLEIDNSRSKSDVYADIIKEASYQKNCLLDYFRKVGIRDNCVKGIFDCVASGTVHSCLEKLLESKLQGFYFGIMSPKKDNLSILSAFGTVSNYNMKSNVLEHYLLVENLLSEMSGTFIGFCNGEMVFEDNVPSDKLPDIQDGILQFVWDATNYVNVDLIPFDYCDEIMCSIFSSKIDVSEEIKEVFVYDDNYLGENIQVRIWQ